MTRTRWLCWTLVIAALAGGSSRTHASQAAQDPRKSGGAVERVGKDQLRVGTVRIDTAKKEVSVSGVVNDVTTLEFLANARKGVKAYESLLELDANAIDFNVALILIGLDPARATVPKFQFDPALPQGDLVEIVVEWDEQGRRRTARASELIINRETKQTLTDGPWVYTGSVFYADTNQFLADIDGTIIGFLHVPSPLIEYPRVLPGAYGVFVLNPDLNLRPGTQVQLTVRALRRP